MCLVFVSIENSIKKDNEMDIISHSVLTSFMIAHPSPLTPS